MPRVTSAEVAVRPPTESPQRKRAGQLNGSERRECRADAEEERLFVSIRVRVGDDQRRHRRRGILLWAWASHRQYPRALVKKEKSAPCVLQYDMCSRHASLSVLARSPVRSSAVLRSGTAGKRGASVGVAASVGQSTSMDSYGSRCRGGRNTQSVTSIF